MNFLHRSSALAAMAVFACLLFVLAAPASACSMCRCGDPTFNALGTDVYKDGAFRVALDWERFDKEQGLSGEEEEALGEKHEGDEHAGGREAMIENRFTTAFTYTFQERLVAVARVPFSSREITESGARTSQDGLSDPEVYALVRLWSSEFAPGLGRRAWISAVGGVKTDWGKNDVAKGGERLDEHLQPGTGSNDWFGGLSGVYLFDSRSSLFGSTQYRSTGANRFGYEYGNIWMANAGYEHKLGRLFDAALELNYRDAGQDRIDRDGFLDPNTGGSLLYLSPRLIVDFGKGLVGRLSVQVPVADGLNGDQKERTVANVGLTYLF
jgi:hypothetical protein